MVSAGKVAVTRDLTAAKLTFSRSSWRDQSRSQEISWKKLMFLWGKNL